MSPLGRTGNYRTLNLSLQLRSKAQTKAVFPHETRETPRNKAEPECVTVKTPYVRRHAETRDSIDLRVSGSRRDRAHFHSDAASKLIRRLAVSIYNGPGRVELHGLGDKNTGFDAAARADAGWRNFDLNLCVYGSF